MVTLPPFPLTHSFPVLVLGFAVSPKERPGSQGMTNGRVRKGVTEGSVSRSFLSLPYPSLFSLYLFPMSPFSLSLHLDSSVGEERREQRDG